MFNARDLDLQVIETVMGWQYDRARTFSPTTNLAHLWEVEEVLLEDPERARRYGAALLESLPAGSKLDAKTAVLLAHLDSKAKCEAALKACGAPTRSNGEIAS